MSQEPQSSSNTFDSTTTHRSEDRNRHHERRRPSFSSTGGREPNQHPRQGPHRPPPHRNQQENHRHGRHHHRRPHHQRQLQHRRPPYSSPYHHAATPQQRTTAGAETATPNDPCVVCQTDAAKYKCPTCLARYCSVACCRTHKECCGAATSSGGQRDQPHQVAQTAQNMNTDTTQTTSEITDSRKRKTRYGIELERAREILGLSTTHRDEAATEASTTRDRDDRQDDLDEGWKLTEPMISAMHHCDWLKKELQDDNLQQLLRLIVTRSKHVVRSGGRRQSQRDDRSSCSTEQEVVLDRLKSELPAFRRFLDKLLVVVGVLERPPSATNSSVMLGLNDWLNSNVATESECLTLKPLPRPSRFDPQLNDGSGSGDGNNDEDDGSSSTSSESSSSSDSDNSMSSDDTESEVE